MEPFFENKNNLTPSDFIPEVLLEKEEEFKKCYTCRPRGTIKEHIISQTEHFKFNHDMFRRPLIIITSRDHYHNLY